MRRKPAQWYIDDQREAYFGPIAVRAKRRSLDPDAYDAGSPHIEVNRLRELAKHGRFTVRQEVAQNANTPSDVLEVLASDEEYAVRMGVVENDAAPESALRVLLRRPCVNLQSEIATHPNVSAIILAVLAVAKGEFVRAEVASLPKTPGASLAVLACDSCRNVVRSAAHNPSTPPSALVRLASHDDEDVIEAIAGNPSTPPPTLSSLARHGVDYVRYRVAENPSTPRQTLARLIQDPVAYISRAAKIAYVAQSLPPETYKAIEDAICAGIASGRDLEGLGDKRRLAAFKAVFQHSRRTHMRRHDCDEDAYLAYHAYIHRNGLVGDPCVEVEDTPAGSSP